MVGVRIALSQITNWFGAQGLQQMKSPREREGGGGEEEEDDGKTKTQKAQVRRTIHVVPDNSRVESGSKNLARG